MNIRHYSVFPRFLLCCSHFIGILLISFPVTAPCGIHSFAILTWQGLRNEKSDTPQQTHGYVLYAHFVSKSGYCTQPDLKYFIIFIRGAD
jgi:hypothetical protein